MYTSTDASAYTAKSTVVLIYIGSSVASVRAFCLCEYACDLHVCECVCVLVRMCVCVCVYVCVCVCK